MTASCRRTQPSLIDRNQPPDTQLWYAPPDSSDYEYKVHMYWRGLDSDGTTQRFIWAIQDTIVGQGLSWNPALRLRDYRIGRITTRTDSVFSFTAYKDVSGVGVRKNRQAFFVASIDDNGVIDPEPAAVEFVATIGELPEIRFTIYVGGVARPYRNLPAPADTVGMYKPFSISYHGFTRNGQIRGYQYFPLSTSIEIPGSNTWTEDLGDTMRTFPNTVADPLPPGPFRFAAKCIDDAGAESQVDGGTYRRGVAQVVVNFDPDTWITEARWSAFFAIKPDVIQQPFDFADGVPDTIPNRGWVTTFYYAHDNSRDTRLCSLTDPDECIDFQLKLVRSSARLSPAGFEDSNWLPRSPEVHDSDPNSTADSNSVNVSTFEYDFRASAIDENGTRDGTPAQLTVVGNYTPTMDTFLLEDHLGNPVNASGPIDTLEWNFYKGIGWPYDAKSDTVQTNDRFFKEFGFRFVATGHDDVRDPDGAAVGSWQYAMYTDFNNLNDRGTFWQFGRGGAAWIPGDGDNQVDETAQSRYRYDDSTGVDLFADLDGFGLGFVNQVVTLVVMGRDTRLGEPDFTQKLYWDVVPPGEKAGDGRAEPNTINSYNVETFGRWTQPRIVQFYLRFTH